MTIDKRKNWNNSKNECNVSKETIQINNNRAKIQNIENRLYAIDKKLNELCDTVMIINDANEKIVADIQLLQNKIKDCSKNIVFGPGSVA